MILENYNNKEYVSYYTKLGTLIEYILPTNKIKNDFLESKFFRKHYDWKDENEYHWLVVSDKATDLYINFEDSLEAIVLGCDVHNSYYSIFKELEIPVYRLKFIYDYGYDRINNFD